MGTYLYAENNPLQWTDRWGLDVDIYIWNSLPYEGGIPSAGKLHSIFGHVSVDADGKSYSFNQSGMLRNFDYSDRQTKERGGDVFRLRLNRDEEVRLAECLDEDHGSYQALLNNCGHPVQNCLRKIGRQLLPFNRSFPSELKYDLIFSPLSKSHKSFPQNKDWSDPSKW